MPETIAAWASGFSFGLLVFAFWLIAKTSASVARQERKLDALLKHSGVDLSTLAAREAEALIRAGRKIEAIKLYRELTGAGLAEAKAAVEKL
jgi:ribosomal protein L7/L12